MSAYENESSLTIEALRARSNRLRDRVYGPLSTDADQKLLPELLETEGILQDRLQAQRALRIAEKAPATGTDAETGVGRTGGVTRGDAGVRRLGAHGALRGLQTTGLEATVSVSPRMSQVPTAFVHLLEARDSPLVSVTVATGDRHARVRISSYVEGYSARCVDTIELDRNGRATLAQLPTFFPAQVRQVEELTRATLHVEVDDLDNERAEIHRTIPIWLAPRTTAYLTVVDPSDGATVDFTRYLAAWVTPNAPSVMSVLRIAADRHPDKQIVGYQGPSGAMDETVRSQVKAIYEALQLREITYVNSVLALGPGGETVAQRIRLPRESLEQRSANCIDGTVLMASLLEAASLNGAIVIVPGHAFLAVELAEGSDRWAYVETTMLGSHDFAAALERGRRNIAQHDAKRGSMVTRHEIVKLRGAGIFPME